MHTVSALATALLRFTIVAWLIATLCALPHVTIRDLTLAFIVAVFVCVRAVEQWLSLRPREKPLCATTLTPRNPRTAFCVCETYPANLGPCDTFEMGSNGLCVYCDHRQSCHDLAHAKQTL